MKKKTVAKLKVTRKLEDILPAFLCCFAYHGITIKRSYPHGNSFSTYPIQYQLDYISDFSNISTISTLLSAIFSLYRRFDIGYRLTDNFRQSIYTLYPTTTIKRSYPHSNSFSIYPIQYQPDYINDFSNISAISTLLSAIFSLYRRFDIGYRLTDNFRQSIYALYPATTIKRSYPLGNFFSIYPAQYQPDYINDFSNISIVSPLISTIFSLYRRFDTRYRFNDNLRHSKRTTYPIPQAIYCRALRLKR